MKAVHLVGWSRKSVLVSLVPRSKSVAQEIVFCTEISSYGLTGAVDHWLFSSNKTREGPQAGGSFFSVYEENF